MKSSSLSPRQRLAKYSKHDPKTGCVYWIGGKSTNGYGVTQTVDGRSILVHRMAYQLENGPIPETFNGKPSVIMHRCGNKNCIAPACLELGTQKKNMAHPVTKARQKAAKKRRGPALTAEQKSEINSLFEKGLSNYFIAQRTGRSEPHLSTLRKRYVEQKKIDATTELLKDVSSRLAVLLDLPRKKPSAPAPAASGGVSDVA